MKNDETIEKLNPIKDLEFVITDDMKETIFEMLTIQQMLNSDELSKRERKMLEKQKQDLLIFVNLLHYKYQVLPF